jgi:hypothetical protein
LSSQENSQQQSTGADDKDFYLLGCRWINHDVRPSTLTDREDRLGWEAFLFPPRPAILAQYSYVRHENSF